MKNLHLLTSLIFFSQYIFAQQSLEPIPYLKDGKWGYCNTAKKIIIQPKYEEAGSFCKNLAVVRLNGKNLVVNANGKEVFESDAFINNYFDNFFIVENESMYDAYDENGKLLISKFNLNDFFGQTSFCSIEQSGKHGVINSAFNFLLEPKYDKITRLDTALFYIENKDGASLYHATEKKQYSTEKFEKIFEMKENAIMVLKNGKYGFIDDKGKIIIKPEYEKPHPEHNYLNEDGGFLNFNYKCFSEGLAVLKKKKLYGYVDKSGKTIIPFKFDRAFGFSGGLAWVSVKNKWGMINTKGEIVIDCIYENPNYLSSKELEALDGFHEELINVRKNNKYGFIDKSGKTVIPFNYDEAYPFHKGIAPVKLNDKWGFVNKKGELVIPAIYDYVNNVGNNYHFPFENNFEMAQLDDKWVAIDTKGKQILPDKYFFEYDFNFNDGLLNLLAEDKRIVVDKKGEIVNTFDANSLISPISGDLWIDLNTGIYFNVRTGVKYTD
jgi:hypothetical protein